MKKNICGLFFLLLLLAVFCTCSNNPSSSSGTSSKYGSIAPKLNFKSARKTISFPQNIIVIAIAIKNTEAGYDTSESFYIGSDSTGSLEIQGVPVGMIDLGVGGLNAAGDTIYWGETNGLNLTTGTTATPDIDIHQMAPKAPTNLTVNVISPTQISLSWQDNSGNEDGFQAVINGSPDTNFVANANDTSMQITGLSPSTGYTFAVRSFNEAGYSVISDSQSATTDNLVQNDTISPRVTIIYPYNNASVNNGIIQVQVSAYDENGVSTVNVNGSNATLTGSDWTVLLTLTTGSNEIVAVATDNSTSGNQASDTIYVTYDTDIVDTVPPNLTVNALPETTNQVSVTISGTAADANGIMHVLVDSVVAIGKNAWTIEKVLTPGPNNISVIAVDNNSNYTPRTVHIVFDSTAEVSNIRPQFSVQPWMMDSLLETNVTYLDTLHADDADGDTLTYELVVNPDGMTIINDSVIEWTPMTPDTGSHEVSVLVKDGGGLSDTISWTISVTYNFPPVFGSIVDMLDTAEVDSQYRDTLRASDADGDKIYYELLSDSIDGMLITDSILTWTPIGGYAGSAYEVSIQAEDNQGGFDTLIWSIYVRQANSAPQITSSPGDMNSSANVGQLYSDTVHAVDTPDDFLTFSIPQPIGDMDFQDSVLMWTPLIADAGTHIVTIYVTDRGGLSDSLEWSIEVLIPNQRPRFTVTPSVLEDSARVNVLYHETLSANDPDGDRLTYSIIGGMVGNMQLVDSLFSWTPSSSEANDFFVVTVMVEDEQGAADTLEWTIHCGQPNRPPEFLDMPSMLSDTAYAGYEFAETLHVDDPDGDQVTLNLLSTTNGMRITDSVFTWTPMSSMIGNSETIQIQADDGNGMFDTLTWNVHVAEPVVRRFENMLPPIPGTDPIQCMAVNKDGDFFIGTNGSGLYMYIDGPTWGQSGMLPIENVTQIAIDTAQTGHIFVGTENVTTGFTSICYTMNKGNVWLPMDSTSVMQGPKVNSIIVIDKDTIFASNNENATAMVFRSMGYVPPLNLNRASFGTCNDGLQGASISCMYYDRFNKTLYAGNSGGFMFYNNNHFNCTWTSMNNQLSTGIYSIAVNANGNIFAGDGEGLHFKQDRQSTGWNQLDNSGSVNFIEINSQDHLFFSGNSSDYVNVSTDNGSINNQVSIGSGNYVQAMTIGPDGSFYVVGSDRQIKIGAP